MTQALCCSLGIQLHLLAQSLPLHLISLGSACKGKGGTAAGKHYLYAHCNQTLVELLPHGNRCPSSAASSSAGTRHHVSHAQQGITWCTPPLITPAPRPHSRHRGRGHARTAPCCTCRPACAQSRPVGRVPVQSTERVNWDADRHATVGAQRVQQPPVHSTQGGCRPATAAHPDTHLARLQALPPAK